MSHPVATGWWPRTNRKSRFSRNLLFCTCVHRMTPGWFPDFEFGQDDARMMPCARRAACGTPGWEQDDGACNSTDLNHSWEALRTTCLILLQAEIQRVGSLWVMYAKRWKYDPYNIIISNGLRRTRTPDCSRRLRRQPVHASSHKAKTWKHPEA